MAKSKKASKRERLITAAAELFHHNGSTNSSLADIANKAKIPIGNVYYYFKTKEELILAVIEKRQETMAQAYDTLNSAFADPRERMIQALSFFTNIKADYTAHGCPLGRMVMEFGIEHQEARKAVAAVMAEFVSWAASQFEALGHKEEAKNYAISLMAGIEGAAVMAKAYGDESVFEKEMQRLRNWVESIPNKNVPFGKFKAA